MSVLIGIKPQTFSSLGGNSVAQMHQNGLLYLDEEPAPPLILFCVQPNDGLVSCVVVLDNLLPVPVYRFVRGL